MFTLVSTQLHVVRYLFSFLLEGTSVARNKAFELFVFIHDYTLFIRNRNTIFTRLRLIYILRLGDISSE